MKMPSRSLRAVLCTILCTLAMPLSIFAADSPNASGSLKVGGRTTLLQYAYAFRDAAGTRVLVSSKPVSAAMLAAEAAIGAKGKPSPFRDLVRKGEVGAIELLVRPDGILETVVLFDKAFETPLPNGGETVFWYEPYRMASGWTGGRSRTREQQDFFDTKWEYDVAFFAPVGQKGFEIPSAAAIAAQRKDVDTREKARIVAPGGGEEGAMYAAFHKNMEAGNTKALHEQMTPGMKTAVAEQMQAATLTDSDLASWAIMHGVPPAKLEIIGGVRDADGTLLELRKTSTRSVKFGTAKIVKHEGRWKVAEENW